MPPNLQKKLWNNAERIDVDGVWGGWSPTIPVAWGLTRPKSAPGWKEVFVL